MADFDNGLPPANADLTGKKVSDVSIRQKEANNDSQQAIQAVNIQTASEQNKADAQIKAVSIDAKQSGKNRLMYM